MRILILGGSGQLGVALQRELRADHQLSAPSSAQADLRDPDGTRRAIEHARADVVINAAAYTRVDDAESDAEPATALNARAPGIVAASVQAAGTRLIHISTDYVFDGECGAPYEPSAPGAPVNVYGASKLAGERAVLAECERALVVRTAWLHSADSTNFVATAVRVLRSGKVMRVVDDQVGTPTRAAHLAQAVARLVRQPDTRGLLHFTDSGVASWFDVATCVAETLRSRGALGSEGDVLPICTAQNPLRARRPRVSLLDKHESWLRIGWTPPHWRVGVSASINEILDA